MSDALTLCQGKKSAAFRRLTVGDMLTVRALQQQHQRLALADFPALRSLTGDAYLDHPDQPRYAAIVELRCDYLPWMVGAWGDEAPTPTYEDLIGSDDDELFQCMRAIATLNPQRLTEMPRVVRASLPN